MAEFKTLAQLRTAVRDLLDESSASFWTDATLNRYINRAKDRVWVRVRSLNEDYFIARRTSEDGAVTILGSSYNCNTSLTLSTSTRYFTLPPDFSEMKQIECITSGYEDLMFHYRDINSPDMRAAMAITDALAPGDFYFDIIEKRTLVIAPYTDTELDIRVTYVQQQPDMESASEDSDYLEFPYPLHLAVEAYATALALRQDRNPDAAVAKADGDTIIAEFLGSHQRQLQEPEVALGYLES